MKTFSGIQMVLIWMLAMCMPAFAGLGDLDLQTQRYGSLIASDTGEAQTIGVTVIAPVDLDQWRCRSHVSAYQYPTRRC